MNHNRVEDTAPRYADSSDQAKQAERDGEERGGDRGVGRRGKRREERAKREWEEEREKDGLEEENGIKRIQMEEWETDRRTDTHRSKKVRFNQPKKHTLHI